MKTSIVAAVAGIPNIATELWESFKARLRSLAPIDWTGLFGVFSWNDIIGDPSAALARVYDKVKSVGEDIKAFLGFGDDATEPARRAGRPLAAATAAALAMPLGLPPPVLPPNSNLAALARSVPSVPRSELPAPPSAKRLFEGNARQSIPAAQPVSNPVTVDVGGIVVHAQPGQSAEELADEIARVLETRSRFALHDGGQP